MTYNTTRIHQDMSYEQVIDKTVSAWELIGGIVIVATLIWIFY